MRLQRIKEGERITARQYNALLDQLERKDEGLLGVGSGLSEGDCTVYAVNDSGEDAPWGAAVSITGRAADDIDALKFEKPGDPPYGILTEPVANGSAGLVAVAGGPWHLKSDTGTIGALLKAQADDWEATEGSGPWCVVGNVQDGLCLAYFAGGVTNGIVFSLDGADTADTIEIPAGSVIRNLTYNGTDEDGNLVIQVDTGCLYVNP